MFNEWETLPQYHFERDDFVKAFYEFFTSEQIVDIETLCQETTYLDHFILLYHEDEFYILHKASGVVINWYKHLGRTNTCNREDFTLDDLREFLKILSNDWGFDKRSNFWHKCSYEDGRLIHDGSWVPGKWYEWKSISGETECARMKRDIPDDHFFPPPSRIFEENVIAFRELEEQNND